MNIITLNENAYFKAGNFYADILEEDGNPFVILFKEGKNELKEIIDEYDIIDESVKLGVANGLEVSLEMEYDKFIKWLESHETIDTIFVTSDVLRNFYLPFEDECYIDPEDGFAKFPDSDE